MALSRKQLKALGIEDDKIDLIIEAHTETVNGLKDQIETLKNNEPKPESAHAKDGEGKDAAKDSGKDAFEDKYNQTKKELDDLKKSIADEKLLEKKKAAFKELCKDAGLSDKGLEKAVKYAEWDKIELDEKDEIKGKKDVLNGVKEEWSDYVQTTGTKGAETATPPAGEAEKPKPNQAFIDRIAAYRAEKYGAQPATQATEGG